MTSDEARDLFGDALEPGLEGERKAAFEAALAGDEELRSEWEAYRAVVEGAARVGRRADDAPVPDLLPRVQSRIRARSRGRYYRDRFSEQSGMTRTALPLMGAILLALIVAAAWVAMQSLIAIEGP